MITEHYNVKWLKNLRIDAITFGTHIFYQRRRSEIQSWLRKHEEAHVNQYKYYGILGFLIRYILWYIIGRLKGEGHWEAYNNTPL